MKEKIVGILGGMGPDATVDIFDKIIKATPTKEESDHLRIIIDNNPKLPSRQDAILLGTESPVPAMIESGLLLAGAGADFIILGANTAHWFQPEMQRGVPVPILHIIEECAAYVRRTYPQLKSVGMLATSGAMKTGMFQDFFKKSGINCVVPDEAEQSRVHNAIMEFKHNALEFSAQRAVLLGAADSLADGGAEAVIMGCTEIPIILQNARYKLPLINPNVILAEVVAQYAKSGIPPISARMDR